MRDTQRERQRHRQREKQAPCRQPDMGLDPGSPGSHPGPKAGTKLLSHPGIPNSFIFHIDICHAMCILFVWLLTSGNSVLCTFMSRFLFSILLTRPCCSKCLVIKQSQWQLTGGVTLSLGPCLSVFHSTLSLPIVQKRVDSRCEVTILRKA